LEGVSSTPSDRAADDGAPVGAVADEGGTPEPSVFDRVWPFVGVALLAAAVALPLLRQRGSRSWDTVWAEDGAVFASQAVNEGGLSVLLRGYAGYVQFPPRILAVVAGLLPVDDLAQYLAVAGVVVTALIAWFVYSISESWVHSRWLRVALASLIVLMPALGEENTANITNTIWAFAAVCPWALMALPVSRRQLVACGAVAFFAPTATMLSIIFLPLAIGQAVVRRTAASQLVAGCFMVGLAFQGAVSLATPDSSPPSMPSAVRPLIELTATRVFGVYLAGVEWTSDLWEHHESLVLFGAPLLTALIIVVLLPGAGRGAQVVSLVFAGYAVISFAAPIWVRGTSLFGDASPSFGALRYSVIPVFLLASAVTVLAAPAGQASERVRARVARPLFVAQIAVLAVAGFAVTNARSDLPTWSFTTVAIYEQQCGGEPSSDYVVVPVLGAFGFGVECSRLAP
jgi:hypothetical protein